MSLTTSRHSFVLSPRIFQALLRSAICLMLFLPFSARANIFLDRNILVFPAHQRPIQNLKVTNGDSNNRTLAVHTEVKEVINPGSEESQTIPSKALVVAPNAFELTPKQQRNVRILLREPNTSNRERVFRINFLPRRPERSVVDNATGTEPTDAPAFKLNVLIGMGTLIFVLPREIDYRFEHQREADGKSIHFINHGNVSVHLQPRTICSYDNEDHCFRFEGMRVHPGLSRTYTVPEGFEKAPLTFSVQSAGRHFALDVGAPAAPEAHRSTTQVNQTL